MSNKSPFGSTWHFVNIGSWKAGSPISNPLRTKAQSRQLFIASWLLLHGNMGPTLARCHNKWPWRSQTTKSKLHCDGHELLGSSKDSKFGYRKFMAKDHSKSSLIQSDPYWFTDQTSTLTIELDCDSMSWMSLQQRIAGMDSLNKHVEQISFRQYMTFCDILWTSAAERLAAPFPTHCCQKLNLDNCSLICSSHIAQLRAQSIYCNNCWRPQLRDQTLCFSALDWSCNKGMSMIPP